MSDAPAASLWTAPGAIRCRAPAMGGEIRSGPHASCVPADAAVAVFLRVPHCAADPGQRLYHSPPILRPSPIAQIAHGPSVGAFPNASSVAAVWHPSPILHSELGE